MHACIAAIVNWLSEPVTLAWASPDFTQLCLCFHSTTAALARTPAAVSVASVPISAGLTTATIAAPGMTTLRRGVNASRSSPAPAETVNSATTAVGVCDVAVFRRGAVMPGNDILCQPHGKPPAGKTSTCPVAFVTVRPRTPEECCRACFAAPQQDCKGWTMSDGECWLKHVAGPLRQTGAAGHISGSITGEFVRGLTGSEAAGPRAAVLKGDEWFRFYR